MKVFPGFNEYYCILDGRRISIQIALKQAAQYPCFVTGMSTLVYPTLSNNFKKQFQIILCNMYWENHPDFDEDYRSNLTLEKLVDDIETMRQQLAQRDQRFKKIFLIGQSTPGIIALMYAIKYPQHTYGVITIATPTFFNETVFIKSEEYFKLNYEKFTRAENKNYTFFTEDDTRIVERLSGIVEKPIDMKDYDFWIHNFYLTQGPKIWVEKNFWQNERNFVNSLYKDNIDLCLTMPNHFFGRILPGWKLVDYLSKLCVPVHMAFGMADMLVPYILYIDELIHNNKIVELEAYLKNPLLLPCSYFLYTGAHWPHFEPRRSQVEFDVNVAKWVEALKLNRGLIY